MPARTLVPKHLPEQMHFKSLEEGSGRDCYISDLIDGVKSLKRELF